MEVEELHTPRNPILHHIHFDSFHFNLLLVKNSMTKENSVPSKYEALFREDFTLIMVTLSGLGAQAEYVRSLWIAFPWQGVQP